MPPVQQTNGISRKTFIVGLVLIAVVGFVAGVGFQAGPGFQSLQRAGNDKDLPEDLDYSSVEQLYDTLRKQYDGTLTKTKVLDGLKRGLVASTGDPYTTYLSPKEAQDFQDSLNGEFDGIGAEIAIKNDQLQVVAPLPATPAEKAGLRAGDPIIAIDGKDTADLSVEQAVTRIRGKKGSTVTLTIVRDKKPVEVPIVRDSIKIDDATGKVIDGKIGYIELRTFGEASARQVEAIAQDFKAQGVKKVILDLRNNSGGLLDQSVDIAGIWLDGQVVVTERSADGKEEVLRAERGGILHGTELVILINGGSASASEIVAGALQDHKVATIVGEKSFGKGSVQTITSLGNGAELKVTVARWYTPSGKSIDKAGISPDKKVELTDKDFDKSRDPQLDAAVNSLK